MSAHGKANKVATTVKPMQWNIDNSTPLRELKVESYQCQIIQIMSRLVSY